MYDCFVGCVLWHYNPCKFFNTNSFYNIYIKYILFVIEDEGNQKTLFSIATTPRCREGHYSFPWIAPLYPRYVPYIAEC